MSTSGISTPAPPPTPLGPQADVGKNAQVGQNVLATPNYEAPESEQILTPAKLASDLEAIDRYLDVLQETHKNTVGGKLVPFDPRVPKLNDPAGMPADVLILMLTEVMNKLNTLSIQTEEMVIKQRDDLKNEKHAENMDQKAESRINKSSANVGLIVASVFSWIATALAVVAATVVAVVSFGTASFLVGTVAVIGAAMSVTLSVLAATGAMEKILEPLANGISDMLIGFGVDPKIAKVAGKIAAQVIISAVVIAIQIAMTVMTLGAGSGGLAASIGNRIAGIASKIAASSIKAAAKFASYSAKIATAVVKGASKVGTFIAENGTKISGGIVTATTIGSGASSAASGAATIASGAYQKRALDAEADSELIKAIIDELQARLDTARDFIKMLIKMMQGNTELVNDLIDLNSHSREAVLNNQKNYA